MTGTCPACLARQNGTPAGRTETHPLRGVSRPGADAHNGNEKMNHDQSQTRDALQPIIGFPRSSSPFDDGSFPMGPGRGDSDPRFIARYRNFSKEGPKGKQL